MKFKTYGVLIVRGPWAKMPATKRVRVRTDIERRFIVVGEILRKLDKVCNKLI
jgi:hypothetical protein